MLSIHGELPDSSAWFMRSDEINGELVIGTNVSWAKEVYDEHDTNDITHVNLNKAQVEKLRDECNRFLENNAW